MIRQFLARKLRRKRRGELKKRGTNDSSEIPDRRIHPTFPARLQRSTNTIATVKTRKRSLYQPSLYSRKKSHLRFLIEIVLSFLNLRENHCVSVSPLTLIVWSRTHASPQSTSPQFFRYCPGTQGESILMEQNVKSHVNLYQIYLKTKTQAVQRFSLIVFVSVSVFLSLIPTRAHTPTNTNT